MTKTVASMSLIWRHHSLLFMCLARATEVKYWTVQGSNPKSFPVAYIIMNSFNNSENNFYCYLSCPSPAADCHDTHDTVHHLGQRCKRSSLPQTWHLPNWCSAKHSCPPSYTVSSPRHIGNAPAWHAHTSAPHMPPQLPYGRALQVFRQHNLHLHQDTNSLS